VPLADAHVTKIGIAARPRERAVANNNREIAAVEK
jgi:hypothetical protein